MELGSTGVFDQKAYITTHVVHQTRSVLDRNLNFAYCTSTKHTHLRTIQRRTGYMPNCERGVGQGRQSPVDGGEIESDQQEPLRTVAEAAKAVAAGAVAAGRGPALP